MLTAEEADRLVVEKLGTSWRAGHSRLVAALMAALALRVGADAALWRTVGLVHDLDYEVTRLDRRQHGVLVTRWLASALPTGALKAIAAHDQSSGIRSRSLLADMLKLADALAILIDRLGVKDLTGLLSADPDLDRLRARMGEGAHLADMLVRFGDRRGLDIRALQAVITAGSGAAGVE